MIPASRGPLEEREKIAWLRLAMTPRVGPVTFRGLLERFGSAESALEALPDLAARGGGVGKLSPASSAQAEKEMQAARKSGTHLIASCEPDYPALLASIDDAPPFLYARGQLSLLHKKALGIVGARNASTNGLMMAERLAQDLGAAGYVIASGFARGIDTAAHKRALATGTVAALAGGVDVIYPEENAPLYAAMLEQGCVLSEQPLGTEPKAVLFPRRNRLISGLSLGVIVVEAALKSGSLITAHMAAEQGREVFAVPGSPLDQRAGGPNALLRDGAILTASAKDVLEQLASPLRAFKEPELPLFKPAPLALSEAEIDAARPKIAEMLTTSPVAVDELVRRCQFSLPLVLTVLIELELAGKLERHPGHQVSWIG